VSIDFGCAGSHALLDAVQKAGPEEFALPVIFYDIQLAGAKPEYLLQHH
jgi:hypothetical protein